MDGDRWHHKQKLTVICREQKLKWKIQVSEIVVNHIWAIIKSESGRHEMWKNNRSLDCSSVKLSINWDLWMPKWWCVLKRRPADSPKYFKDDTSVNISNKQWWFNKGGCVCGDATQTGLWADGIQQQFVHRWLLKQTPNSGDRRGFFFVPPD